MLSISFPSSYKTPNLVKLSAHKRASSREIKLTKYGTFFMSDVFCNHTNRNCGNSNDVNVKFIHMR